MTLSLDCACVLTGLHDAHVREFESGLTPLQLAVLRGESAIIDTLLKHDPDLKMFPEEDGGEEELFPLYLMALSRKAEVGTEGIVNILMV